MAFKLEWDKDGQRLFETGTDRGVLYIKNTDDEWVGYEWNGLTSVSESPEGGEPNALYADNIKYLNLISPEEFNATVEAYTYPEEFAECDGSIDLGVEGLSVTGQKRKQFALCYRTKIGNDTDGVDHGYKLHIIYNCYAAPSEKGYETINDSPDAITFSWEISTTPVTFTINGETYSSAHIEIDSTEEHIGDLEDALYGTAATTSSSNDAVEAKLVFPAEIYEILNPSE